MSITDPVYVRWHEKGEGYYLVQGRETFYNKYNELMLWSEVEEAVDWAKYNRPWCDILVDDRVVNKAKISKNNKDQQMELI